MKLGIIEDKIVKYTESCVTIPDLLEDIAKLDVEKERILLMISELEALQVICPPKMKGK